MIKCKKCDVLVDACGNACPLCQSQLGKEVNQSTYPKIKSKITKNLVNKVILFIVCVCSFIVLVINRLISSNISWAGFVVAALFSSYIILRSIMVKKRRIINRLLGLNFLIIILAFFWDNYTGYRGWSLNYVLPSLCIFYGIVMLILRLVFYFVFRENSTYIYLNILLEFIPIILFHFNVITFEPLAEISCLFGIVNFLLILLFDGTKFKSDLEKKLHI